MATATEVTHSFSVPKDTTCINKYGQAYLGEKVMTVQEPGNEHATPLPTFHLLWCSKYKL